MKKLSLEYQIVTKTYLRPTYAPVVTVVPVVPVVKVVTVVTAVTVVTEVTVVTVVNKQLFSPKNVLT